MGRLQLAGRQTLQPVRNFQSTAARHAVAEAVSSAQTVVNHRPVGYWLLGMGGLVAGMVTVGGITRLTRSGLSMTDWKLHGSVPPITTEEWEVEFERYKQFPEWQQRQSMTLNEFKFIYFWEYAHRMMGRFIGVAFTVPGLYFAARGMIPKYLYPRMALLFSMGGCQGLIGWWMVKSGLEMDPQQRREIRVSPYRLATHLSMAFTTYVLLIWTGLDVLRSPEQMKQIAVKMPQQALQQARVSPLSIYFMLTSAKTPLFLFVLSFLLFAYREKCLIISSPSNRTYYYAFVAEISRFGSVEHAPCGHNCAVRSLCRW